MTEKDPTATKAAEREEPQAAKAMELLFERSVPGRGCDLVPPPDVPAVDFGEELLRRRPPRLPELSEVDLSRHYSKLARHAHGVNDGPYPLGSCTMKYNPSVNERVAALPGFADLHPLQPLGSVQGALAVLHELETLLTQICGMDRATFQPAAGAQGEYTGLLLIRACLAARGQAGRTKVIVPDSAHGTNPASATMAGFAVVSVGSTAEGGVKLDELRAALGPDTAALMLTNPNTLGLFDPNIVEICRLVHDAGALCYYDGANLNAIMGRVRPGDMGFDCMHVNLHKTFSTPHGGGGPGSGPVLCKEFLAEFLPGPVVREQTAQDGSVRLGLATPAKSVGRVRSFYGNFLTCVRALTYLKRLGAEGVCEASAQAVLNANYLAKRLSAAFDLPFGQRCMHEFVMSLAPLKERTGVTAMDVAKRLLDFGIHPPTMYFPLIVHEALMVEPTETEDKKSLDHVADVLLDIAREAQEAGGRLHEAPFGCFVGRPDEVTAARHPLLRHEAPSSRPAKART
ncbi:aminomethyl-transferring glycine dehydrogenase subunit GcvPB [Olsenella massiliensis]|uniref:aminomethyl-transferring glycine dehydrogenase subunit GcvPB n=1 Tax=Olsenella massiliensis TaxID=1622075 RepID=UPI000B1F7151|nr:aminomethyl-transferring glycine dehydrogenase subunit GcvPB [Olsenella massiliensis]